MPPPETIIFDLDGTLIDSSRSILAGFETAFSEERIALAIPLTPEIIGPPLKDTLALLAGRSDPVLIERLADRFKKHYDTEGYKQTVVFPGIDRMLESLQAAGVALHIATNKRIAPTLKILDFLGWTTRFGLVRGLDSWSPPAANKAIMIQWLLKEIPVENTPPMYVGDRSEDAAAAFANQLPFAFAAWGYGDPANAPEHQPLQSPTDLLNLALQ